MGRTGPVGLLGFGRTGLLGFPGSAAAMAGVPQLLQGLCPGTAGSSLNTQPNQGRKILTPCPQGGTPLAPGLPGAAGWAHIHWCGNTALPLLSPCPAVPQLPPSPGDQIPSHPIPIPSSHPLSGAVPVPGCPWGGSLVLQLLGWLQGPWDTPRTHPGSPCPAPLVTESSSGCNDLSRAGSAAPGCAQDSTGAVQAWMEDQL